MKYLRILPRKTEEYVPRATALTSRPQIYYYREISVTLSPDFINLHGRLRWPSYYNWLDLWLKQWRWNWTFSLASKLYHNIIRCSNKTRSFSHTKRSQCPSGPFIFISKQMPTAEVCKYEVFVLRRLNGEKSQLSCYWHWFGTTSVSSLQYYVIFRGKK